MFFDWSEYSADSGTEEVPLLLSARSQSLILAAMQSLEFRSNWEEIDDATWDDISAAIGEAYEEIMEVVVPETDTAPVGTVMAWVGEIADIPIKWLRCDGAAYLGADYPELFASLAAIFKTETHFTTPEMDDRFLLGSGVNDDVGELGGENQHILTVGELPIHRHVVPAHSHNILKASAVASQNTRAAQGNNTGLADQVTSTQPATDTSDTGSGEAHNNMPAYIAVHWILKALP